jgi:PAS domain S-box-containing protein
MAMPARIIFPALISVALFVATIFQVVLPRLESMLLARKREMLQALTQGAWSILAEHEARAAAGVITRAEAQDQALALLRGLRYGPEGKDYYWVNDLLPVLRMHPYRADLEGQAVGEIVDPAGKRLFAAFSATVREQGQGFVDYMWQWKDDPGRIVPKISHVRGFAPWEWVVGTGIYVEDVRQEIGAMTRDLTWGCAAISFLALGLAGFSIQQGVRSEDRRRRAEALLGRSEQKYRLLVENAGDFILTCGPDRVLSFANRSFLQTAGYPEAQLLKMAAGDLASPEERGAFIQYLAERSVGGRQAAPHLCRWRKVDGTPLEVELIAVPLEGRGPAQGMMIAARDCTFKRQAELQARRHQEELMQAARSTTLGVLVEGLADEVDSLAREAGAGQGAPCPPSPLQARIQKIARIFSDLCDFARLGPPVSSAMLDVNLAVQKAATLTERLLEREGLRFSLALEPSLPRFRGNGARLQQTLVHLLINAGQATPSGGGPVRVQTRFDSGANRIVIEIEDFGEGMGVETLRRAKEPFFTTRRASGAVGLGLSIAERCIRDHGGELELLSAPGMGTTVRIGLAVGPAWERHLAGEAPGSRSLGA